MKRAVLYGVGVGPGDKKLLTLQAVEIIKNADIIAIPDTGNESVVMEIVSDYIRDKPIIFCKMPMTKDKNILSVAHEESASKIATELDKNKSVAFLTLGDPTIYSTYAYLHEIILLRGYEAKMISGITSFCAAAAALNISLCEADMPLIIIPVTYSENDELMRLKGSKVLMKSGKNLSPIKALLKDAGAYKNAVMVERCSMSNEKLYNSLDDASDSSSYFSTIIVKDKR